MLHLFNLRVTVPLLPWLHGVRNACVITEQREGGREAWEVARKQNSRRWEGGKEGREAKNEDRRDRKGAREGRNIRQRRWQGKEKAKKVRRKRRQVRKKRRE